MLKIFSCNLAAYECNNVFRKAMNLLQSVEKKRAPNKVICGLLSADATMQAETL